MFTRINMLGLVSRVKTQFTFRSYKFYVMKTDNLCQLNTDQRLFIKGGTAFPPYALLENHCKSLTHTPAIDSNEPKVFSLLYLTYKNPSSSLYFSKTVPINEAVCGKVSPMNTKSALPGLKCNLSLRMWMNCPTVRSRGTKNFLLSSSGKSVFETLSTITGDLSAYFSHTFCASVFLSSNVNWSLKEGHLCAMLTMTLLLLLHREFTSSSRSCSHEITLAQDYQTLQIITCKSMRQEKARQSQ